MLSVRAAALQYSATAQERNAYDGWDVLDAARAAVLKRLLETAAVAKSQA